MRFPASTFTAAARNLGTKPRVTRGLPVPKYPGTALDPPLRSRFAARTVKGDNAFSLPEAQAGLGPRVGRLEFCFLPPFVCFCSCFLGVGLRSAQVGLGLVESGFLGAFHVGSV